MLFVEHIHFDERIKTKKRQKIFKKINAGKPVRGILLLIRVERSPNILEIVSSHELYRLERLERHLAVVGVVKDKETAYELIEQWIGDTYTKYGRILSNDLDKEFDIQW